MGTQHCGLPFAEGEREIEERSEGGGRRREEGRGRREEGKKRENIHAGDPQPHCLVSRS